MSSAGFKLEFALSFVAVAFLMVPLLRVAPRLGLLDRPDTRKQHFGDTPMVGGLALYMGVILVLALHHYAVARTWALLSGGALVVIAGVVDDRSGLSPKARFLFQTAACGVMVFGAGVWLRDFGQLLWPSTLELGHFGMPITLFCVVGVINAVNMIDGMDGLSASVSLVALAGLAAALLVAGQSLGSAPELSALAGGLCAFLMFNLRLPGRRRARAFLGDAGTLLLGFLMGWLLVERSQGELRVIAPVTALWLVAIPLMDTVFVMIKRRQAGMSMFEADREHLHHAYLRSGRSVTGTLLAMVVLAALLAALGLAMQWSGIPEYVSFLTFMGTCGVYYAVMSGAWRHRMFLGRRID